MTMFFDSHIHTSFSADSEMRAEEALARAEEQGIGLVFTEHLDYDYPSAGKEQFIFDPEAYWTTYASTMTTRRRGRSSSSLIPRRIGLRTSPCAQRGIYRSVSRWE